MKIEQILYLKLYILKNKMIAVKKESSLKLIVIILFIAGYGIGSFWVFLEGFDYINKTMGLGYFLIDKLFYIYFFILFTMLTTSQLIITYSNFYRNEEVEFLFSQPIDHTSLFLSRFIESTFLSSWAFLFLSVPFFLAYGVGRSLGISFYVIGIVYSIPFILITAGIGSAICVLIVRYFPKKFFKIIAVSGILLSVVLFLYYKRARGEVNFYTSDLGIVIDRLLKHTRISLNPLLPSCWVSKGILSAVSKDWGDVLFYFLVLLSSALFFLWLCLGIGKKIYFLGWEGLKTGQRTKLYLPKSYFNILNKMRLGVLVSKDLKLFYRDPVQWSQFAIFFGMIAVYILNLRNMHYDLESVFWKNLISYLNMGTLALILGVLCTRFIYPQMSLEARRLWIIGMTPVGIGKVIAVKYIVSICLCGFITTGLIVCSNLMVKVPPYMFWLTAGTMIIMGLTLPALALGLGAVFPNPKEDDMAKIVSGFGGTLTLVLSLGYIIAVLVAEIIPIHLYFTKQVISQGTFIKWIVSICIAIIVVSGFTAIVSLSWGYRSMNKLEI